MRRWSRLSKRCFDLLVSFIALVLLGPVFLVIGFLIITDSRGPVIFRQQRIGKEGKRITIFKFRTMVPGASKKGLLTIGSNDPRITALGRYLRKLKKDPFL